MIDGWEEHKIGRKDGKFTVNSGESAGAEGSEERNFADSKGSTGSNHSEDIWVVVLVGTNDGDENLYFIEVAVREKRSDWPVNHSCGQDFFC